MLKGYPIRALLPYAVNHLCQKMRQFIHTRITRILALWWGIKLGESSKFFGIPIIRKHPTGNIIIGSNAIFRSAEWSNTVGLNRHCVLSASRDAEIIIGNDCGFSSTVIAAADSIMIGNRVLCGANCTIVDTDRHPLDSVKRMSKGVSEHSPILIGDDVWLGMNVVILKGVKIGRGTVVAANSVVTKLLPPNILAAGTPANKIRDLL